MALFLEMVVPGIVLCLLLLLAAWHDVGTRRIPNRLVFPGTLIGLALNTFLPAGAGFLSEPSSTLGFLAALGGAGIGVVILLPLYAMGAMGAGDVKLMAMVGAFLGVRGTIDAILLTLVAGGVLAIAIALRKRKVGALSTNLSILIGELKIPSAGVGRLTAKLPVPSVGDMPYAVAIAIGTIVQIILMQNDFTIF